ncbi:Periplasmic binding protein [Hyella patelloides LEGE 07179]|uniref:Periplasmic binding protein n=1 Tax=Hyella patelloides LEGE 07179 TaxID=945734 RepID=A0A563VML4_9CYAN|nr:iron-siderophore ABC transporter substrate-binding protein [Hyella patelloides]VEP12525.1 Periplasmic binding protein [Hyella patelloides LEGE 07179]
MSSKILKLKPFVIALLSTIVIVACQNDPIRQPTNSQLADCRTVQHVMGEVCVPETLQRLVSLDNVTLADALTVGVSAVGSSLFGQLPDYLTEKIESMELLGASERPNLEKMVRLNPDLIMGIDSYVESIFPQLSQIAPTALGKWNGYPSWREHFNFVARVLAKESEAKVVWDNYDRRIEEIKAALGDRLQDVKVSVAYACCGGISVDTESSFSGSILADIGINRPKSQAAVDRGMYVLSEERISDLDADILFLIVYEDEESQQGLANWQQKPLWNQLKVVQNKQVYLVNSDVWRGGNPIAANLLIDDLYKYFVEQS